MKQEQVMKERNSSVELLRIIAMAMVLLTHYNWSMLGLHYENVAFVGWGGVRIIFEGFLAVCVNLFLIISGYYGLKFKLRSFLNVGLLVTSVLLLEQLTSKVIVPIVTHEDIRFTWDFVTTICFWTKSDYFVVDYLFLILLSPILNLFINTYGKKILPMVVILLAIELWGDDIMGNKYFGVNSGFSIVHFVIMYLLARCLYLYRDELGQIRQTIWMLLYIVCSLVSAFMYVMNVSFSFAYSNPIVIFGAVSLFMVFANKQFYSKKINWIASGTFSVYILHLYFPFHYIISEGDKWLLSHYSLSMYVLLSIPFLVAFYMFAVCYDKVLTVLRRPVLKYCDNIQTKFFSQIDYFKF